ncbi:MAG: hypothetical protein L6V93_12310 [Clostridiales bacterium]|nr:MAG: hypothetical protein L6V93_12310 [Clostridiales bacterium]
MELLQCTYNPDTNCGIGWSKTEIDDIINEIVDAWNNDKQYLDIKSDAILDSEKNMIWLKRNINRWMMLCQQCCQATKEYDCNTGIIKTLYKELKDNGLPYLQLCIICNKDFDAVRYFDLLCDNLCSSDNLMIRNACNTIYSICKKTV